MKLKKGKIITIHNLDYEILKKRKNIIKLKRIKPFTFSEEIIWMSLTHLQKGIIKKNG